MKAYLIGTLFFAQTLFAAGEKPIDYQSLDFTLTVKALRAGNHDSSGINKYFFVTKIYGLPILKEDLKKPFADRKKSEADLGKFAELEIESLKYWTPEKKPSSSRLTVSGDKIRSLISEVMRTFSIAEDQTSIKVVTTMYEMEKKFGWFGDDTKVGEAEFDIVSESLPRTAKTDDKTLTITDAQGTYVEIALDFKQNVSDKKEAEPAPL